MKNEIIKADEFGLEQKQVESIEAAFLPKIQERNGYAKIYNQLIKSDINRDVCEKAGTLRKKLVKVRTGISSIHKTQKSYFLAAGKFCDAWKNKETEPVLQMEKSLQEIESYYEIQEQNRIDKLQDIRVIEVKKYLDPDNIADISKDLGSMDDNIYDMFIAGLKQQFDNKIKLEKEAEKEKLRIENIKQLHETRKEIALPFYQFWGEFEKTLNFGEQPILDFDNFMIRNKKLKAEFNLTQSKIIKENEKLKKESLKRKKLELELKERQRAELKAKEAEIKAIHEEKEKIARIEIAKREKVELELKEKEDAELKAKEDEIKSIQLDLNKSDSEKVKDLIIDFELLLSKYEFQSDKNKQMYANVHILINKTITFIKK